MTPGSQGPNDDGLVKIGGALSVDGVPRGSGKAIRPPTVDMGEARIGSSASPDRPTENAGTPLVRTPESTIHDVAVGGAGRYLIVTLKTARKLIVFDVNAAEFVKTITLPSESSLVIAGAKTLVIAFPDQRLFQRWDLETMTRQGASFPSPIKGRLKGLAMGNDCDGPLLAVWSRDSSYNITQQARFGFVDSKTFTVLKAGPITNGGSQEVGDLSPSGAVSRCTRSSGIGFMSARRLAEICMGSGTRTRRRQAFKRLRCTSRHSRASTTTTDSITSLPGQTANPSTPAGPERSTPLVSQ
jgi:hypothetical protein